MGATWREIGSSLTGFAVLFMVYRIPVKSNFSKTIKFFILIASTLEIMGLIMPIMDNAKVAEIARIALEVIEVLCSLSPASLSVFALLVVVLAQLAVVLAFFCIVKPSVKDVADIHNHTLAFFTNIYIASPQTSEKFKAFVIGLTFITICLFISSNK